MKKEREKTLKYFISEIMNDRSIPKNIKNKIEESLNIINKENQSFEVKVSSIISILDEASSNPNMNFHARTKIWNILSKLEELRSRKR